jgi:hypothetical protein
MPPAESIPRASACSSAYSKAQLVSKEVSGLRPASVAICSTTPAFQSSGAGGASGGGAGRNGLTTTFIASRSQASGRPHTWITTGAPGLATRPASRTPVRFTPLKSEPLLRLLIADLVGEAPTRESVVTLRDDVADLFAHLDEAEASAETLPHRRKYLLLNIEFLRRLLELHLEWVDEVERELAPKRRRKPRGAK